MKYLGKNTYNEIETDEFIDIFGRHLGDDNESTKLSYNNSSSTDTIYIGNKFLDHDINMSETSLGSPEVFTNIYYIFFNFFGLI